MTGELSMGLWEEPHAELELGSAHTGGAEQLEPMRRASVLASSKQKAQRGERQTPGR